MNKQGNILVVDDNQGILSALQMLLEKYFEKIFILSSPSRMMSLLQKEPIDVVLLDMNFGTSVNNGNEGLYWLSEIKKYDDNIQVVLFTAYAEIDLAVKGMKQGANDFIVKPWKNEKLLAILQNAYLTRKSKHKQSKQPQSGEKTGMYWGSSPIMNELYVIVKRVAQTNADILITGENGTGKEVLAREIHQMSPRLKAPMICVDMGAITETLFESELFGHVKGSFTDAKNDREGKFEAANKGTLFLDEIGNLPFHLQAKLLSVVQNRNVIRVGSNSNIPVDIRLICATNRDLQDMVEKNEFREDLLYRINTVHIELPPLRKRREDIIPLAQLFLTKYSEQYKTEKAVLSTAAEILLKEHPWFGNIRELQHAIERAVIMSGGGELIPDNFALSTKEVNAENDFSTLEEMEKGMIAKAMLRHNGNLSAIAEQLGITRQTLYNKIKKYNL